MIQVRLIVIALITSMLLISDAGFARAEAEEVNLMPHTDAATDGDLSTYETLGGYDGKTWYLPKPAVVTKIYFYISSNVNIPKGFVYNINGKTLWTDYVSTNREYQKTVYLENVNAVSIQGMNGGYSFRVHEVALYGYYIDDIDPGGGSGPGGGGNDPGGGSGPGGGGGEPPPKITLKLQAVGLTDRVRLTWNPIGASLYHIYRDGDLIGSTSDTAYEDTNVETDGLYLYQVSAVVDGVEYISNTVRSGPIRSIDFGQVNLPTLADVMTNAWYWIRQYNPFMILVLSLILVPLLIGFIFWLMSKRPLQTDVKENMKDRIMEREAEKQNREMERIRRSAMLERRQRDERVRGERQEREPRATRDNVLRFRAMRNSRPMRPERGGRRGR